MGWLDSLKGVFGGDGSRMASDTYDNAIEVSRDNPIDVSPPISPALRQQNAEQKTGMANTQAQAMQAARDRMRLAGGF